MLFSATLLTLLVITLISAGGPSLGLFLILLRCSINFCRFLSRASIFYLIEHLSQLLPPAYGVRGKVIFILGNVCLFTTPSGTGYAWLSDGRYASCGFRWRTFLLIVHLYSLHSLVSEKDFCEAPCTDRVPKVYLKLAQLQFAPPPPNPEMKILEVSSEVGLQNSKFHFTSTPPKK